MKTAVETRVERSSSGLAFYGEIDHQSVPRLMQAMPETPSVGCELDLSAARRIDSAGLAMLIDWGNRTLRDEQKIRIRGASAQTRQLIEILRLGAMFELLD